MTMESDDLRGLMLDERDAPDIVYHYTDAAGLMGILGSGKFWATDLAYLNDHTEFTHGANEVRRVYKRMSKPERDDIETAMLPAFVGRLHDDQSLANFAALPNMSVLDVLLRELLPSIRAMFIFGVTCFCEEGDLLSQWRGYAASAGGYALGFNSKLLRSSLDREFIPLAPVVYQPRRYSSKLQAKLRSIPSFPAAGRFNELDDLDDDQMLWFMILVST